MSDTDVFGEIGKAQEMARANTDYWDRKKEEDAAKAANVAQAVGESTAANGGVPLNPPDSSSTVLGSHVLGGFKDHLEAFAHKLFHHGLNDNNVPNGQQGVAAPTPDSPPAPSSPDATAAPAGTPPAPAVPSPAAAPTAAGVSSPTGAPQTPAIPSGLATAPPEQKAATVQAVQSAAQQQGVPQSAPPPGKPHSMTHADWHELDRLQLNAKVAALREGKDPEAVDKSMTAMRTAFIQSGMLKGLAAANNAIMKGDQGALKQALKNVNYYLPDGQDLETHTDQKTGNLQYVDPFQPKNADGSPNYVDVTPQHIQLLAENTLDPTKVQATIETARTNSAKIEHERNQDKVALYGATAKVRDANTRALESPARIRLFGAHANYFDKWAQSQADKAAAAAAAKDKVPFAVAQKAADDGGKAAAQTLLGEQETIPLQTVDPKTGQMVDNPSLVAGKTSANNAKQPWWGKGVDGKRLSPSDAAGSISVSSNIAAANVGRMSAQEAAEIGGKVYHLTHVKMQTHTAPDGKSRANNFKVSPDGTTGFLWEANADGKTGTYRAFRMHAEQGNAFISGADQSAPEPLTADEMGDEPPENPADNEPATEPAIPSPGQ